MVGLGGVVCVMDDSANTNANTGGGEEEEKQDQEEHARSYPSSSLSLSSSPFLTKTTNISPTSGISRMKALKEVFISMDRRGEGSVNKLELIKAIRQGEPALVVALGLGRGSGSSGGVGSAEQKTYLINTIVNGEYQTKKKGKKNKKKNIAWIGKGFLGIYHFRLF